MSKEAFIPKNFSEGSRHLIQQANKIIAEYAAMGYQLTLRQLYYQFVSRDIIPNKQSEYKRLGSVINDGRLAGKIDWSAIEDRTRNVEYISTWETPESIIKAVSSQYKEDLWRDQDTHVEVWVEKEALVSVVERTCRRLRVPYFACRGYVSQSEAYASGKRFGQQADDKGNVIIIHLGDHDPSGIDMTRDIRERLGMFARQRIEVRRIALNMDQIEAYNPPPNPAKETDARFRGYQEVHGDESWELDSLDPRVIDQLIETEILQHQDPDRWEMLEIAEKANRDRLKAVYRQWDDVVKFIEDPENPGPEGDEDPEPEEDEDDDAY